MDQPRCVGGPFRHLGVLGLDEGTAVVGREGRFTVVGSGAVTLIETGGMTVHPAGAALDLDIGGYWQLPRLAAVQDAAPLEPFASWRAVDGDPGWAPTAAAIAS